jgi:hypothetical protein
MEPGLNFISRPQLYDLVNTGKTRFDGGESHFAHTFNVAHQAVDDKARGQGTRAAGIAAAEFIPILSGGRDFSPKGNYLE